MADVYMEDDFENDKDFLAEYGLACFLINEVDSLLTIVMYSHGEYYNKEYDLKDRKLPENMTLGDKIRPTEIHLDQELNKKLKELNDKRKALMHGMICKRVTIGPADGRILSTVDSLAKSGENYNFDKNFLQNISGLAKEVRLSLNEYLYKNAK